MAGAHDVTGVAGVALAEDDLIAAEAARHGDPRDAPAGRPHRASRTRARVRAARGSPPCPWPYPTRNLPSLGTGPRLRGERRAAESARSGHEPPPPCRYWRCDATSPRAAEHARGGRAAVARPGGARGRTQAVGHRQPLRSRRQPRRDGRPRGRARRARRHSGSACGSSGTTRRTRGWSLAIGGDGGWTRLGGGREGVRGGNTFTFPVPAPGKVLLLRGAVERRMACRQEGAPQARRAHEQRPRQERRRPLVGAVRRAGLTASVADRREFHGEDEAAAHEQREAALRDRLGLGADQVLNALLHAVTGMQLDRALRSAASGGPTAGSRRGRAVAPDCDVVAQRAVTLGGDPRRGVDRDRVGDQLRLVLGEAAGVCALDRAGGAAQREVLARDRLLDAEVVQQRGDVEQLAVERLACRVRRARLP